MDFVVCRSSQQCECYREFQHMHQMCFTASLVRGPSVTHSSVSVGSTGSVMQEFRQALPSPGAERRASSVGGRRTCSEHFTFNRRDYKRDNTDPASCQRLPVTISSDRMEEVGHCMHGEEPGTSVYIATLSRKRTRYHIVYTKPARHKKRMAVNTRRAVGTIQALGADLNQGGKSTNICFKLQVSWATLFDRES